MKRDSGAAPATHLPTMAVMLTVRTYYPPRPQDPPVALPRERRAHPRYCHGGGVDYLVGPCGERLWARLHDFSAGGLCLSTAAPLEPGAALVVLLRSPGLPAAYLPARVAHCSRSAPGWLVGCQLAAPLTGDFLAVLRRTGAAPVEVAV